MPVAPPPQRRRSPEHLLLPGVGETAGPPHPGAGAIPWDHFDAEVTGPGPPVVVHCRGGLDFAYTDELRGVFAAITEREVVVDLSRLTFIDSTGLSLLLSVRRTLQDIGGTLAIRGATGLVRRVFQAAELADVLDE